jgi:flagellar basal-body rod modification protein FlgD
MSAVTSANSLYQQLAAESQSDSSSSSLSSTNSLATQSTFLQLLVAQLKNQDPTQPVDGTTFVTQLAQFSDVEQNLAMRQDLDAMSLKYDGTNSTTPASTAANQTPNDTQSGSAGTPGAHATGSPTN